MQAGLYDVLRGRFYGGTMLADVPEHERRIQSVMSNLNRLFNTRQGSLAHLPDYGLPEAATIYRDAEYPIEELRKNIKEVVEKYEPRLRRVHITHQGTDDDRFRLSFLITAELERGERVRFQTTFATNDLVHVRRWRAA
ncbi:MAG: type VI secretion system baseplate subunit TssE [Thermoleophilia bacterium]